MSKSQSQEGRLVSSHEWFDQSFKKITDTHELPKPISHLDEVRYRLPNQSGFDAILLKLARYISGLNAGKLLLTNGFLQELCSLQRTLDEIHEDIFFLSLPHFGFEKSADHDNYLNAFWEEEPEFTTFSGKQKNRHQVPRRKIRSYLANINNDGAVDHSAIATSAYLSRLYSGYVHAAAPQILELFDPQKAVFRLTGFKDSPLLLDHASDFENQFFRGVMAVHIVARIKNIDDLAREAFEMHNRLECHFN
ncbi:hypothetical protein [Roseobacter sp. OBYS 0001]|uniref:hypothetical protein n=1 Tax=Roseobacter sp. OBYS 0001 TaxID=882651 RepID=UPI001C7F3B2A|nr:hypothetical protein [Roseobacter sp. OBYS 0001]